MSTAYRDERDAALARVDALLRENARLRAVNGWLHACPGGAPRERVRGALAAAPLMLAAIDEQPAAAPHRAYLETFLGDIATFLMNSA
jgi:hypothetical protein